MSTTSSIIQDQEGFSDRLRKIRTERGLSQQQMAGILKVSYSCYNSWENGKRLPRLNRFRDVADTLNIKVEDLTSPNLSLPVESEKEIPVVDGSMFIGENSPTLVFLKAAHRTTEYLNDFIKPEDLFFFKVKGHAMTRDRGISINDGMIALCTRKFDPRTINHSIVVISRKKREAEIRQINFDGEQVFLESWNEDYDTVKVAQTDVIIWGKILNVSFKFDS